MGGALPALFCGEDACGDPLGSGADAEDLRFWPRVGRLAAMDPDGPARLRPGGRRFLGRRPEPLPPFIRRTRRAALVGTLVCAAGYPLCCLVFAAWIALDRGNSGLLVSLALLVFCSQPPAVLLTLGACTIGLFRDAERLRLHYILGGCCALLVGVVFGLSLVELMQLLQL